MTNVQRGTTFIKRFFKGFLRLPRRLIKFRSVKFEISAIYTLILACILVIFSGVIYFILSQTLFSELDRDLESKAEEISQNIQTYVNVKGDEPPSLLYAVEKTIASGDTTLRRWWYTGFERSWYKQLDKQDLSSYYVNFIPLDGGSLVHSKNMTDLLLELFQQSSSLEGKEKSFYDVAHEGLKLRLLNIPFVDSYNDKFILQVAVSPEPVVELLREWMGMVFLIIPVILILTSFIGYVLASRILRPVERISIAADDITHEDLSRRVKTVNTYKEMGNLVRSFNKMISRLEKSFDHIEQFSSHIAHELKTPLTIMRGENEVALLKKRSPAEYQQVLKSNLEEIQNMLSYVDDLLFLSKMNYQLDCFRFKRINFYEYFHDIYDQTLLLAQERNIKVTLHKDGALEKVCVNADENHLKRLFFNIISNALKFTPDGGRIEFSLKLHEEQLEIRITDSGPGIPHEEREKIFTTFYSAHHLQSGSGLGLGIAQAVANAHGGGIYLEDSSHQGAIFCIYLPIIP